jgi:hypothetical protein
MTEKAYKFKIDREARTARRKRPRAVEQRYALKSKEGDATVEEVALERVRETTAEQVEAGRVVAEMAREYAATINFYKSPECGALPHAEAVERTEALNESRRELRDTPAERVEWSHLAAIGEKKLADALGVWARVRDAADDELESGARSASVTGRLTPFEFAQYLAIRDAFCDEWRPKGGIELAMIDMLTVAFSLQMYWSSIAHQRATGEYDEQNKGAKRYEPKGWKSPYQWKADAIEQAYRLADGYNRQFLRVLRQLRDLRRYAPPVIVNNGGQVNVATDGGQQVNVA